MMGIMTKGERSELLSLVKKRERLMKAQAQERSAALLAEFDIQSATIHRYDDDAVWAALVMEVESVMSKARDEIAKRAKERGIPEEFAPDLSFNWHGRGQNAVADRRAEFRRAAKSKIEAMEREAVTKIERLSLEAQTQIVAAGLDTESAKSFLEAMPKLDQLMPSVEIGEIETLIQTKRAERRLGYYS